MEEGFGWITGLVVAGALVLLWLLASIRVVKEYERGILFFLGRYVGVKEPGLRLVLVPVFRLVVIDLRTVTQDVPPQDVITRDNVSVKVNAVIYFRVIHPDQAVLQVEDHLYATIQLAQTTLRSTVGQNSLDDLLSKREELNDHIQQVLDEHTDPWGVQVTNVEIKHVDLPPDMQRIMARQAEAERERRAKVIAAEGELQAAEKLTEAARKMAEQPGTLQLRYLQTLVEVAAENNSTTLFPLPMELFDGIRAMSEGRAKSSG